MALNKKKKGDSSDPKPHLCDPESTTGRKKRMRGKDYISKTMKDAKNVDQKYKMVRGCIKYAPGSKGGKNYWVDVSADVDVADVQPEIDAMPFDSAGGDYGTGDFAVKDDGSIYTCVDDIFCGKDPTSSLGSKGWEKTPYKTKGIKNYETKKK